MSILLSNLPIIDAHVHLWDRARISYPWLAAVPAIDKDFLIADYQRATSEFPIEKMVFVQCDCSSDQYLEELDFVSKQALSDQRLQAVVAYAPLEQGESIRELLSMYQFNPSIKGVRKMYDQSPEICRQQHFLNAVRMLPSYNLTFDVSIKPSSAKETIDLIAACPDTQFVLDHLGKPDIVNGKLADFKRDIDVFAAMPNVVAKVSGLITEARLEGWTLDDIRPYIDYAIERFGFDRLMYGGDWPVVLLAGSYATWLHTLWQCVHTCSEEELKKLFFETAKRTYRLSD